MEYKKNEVFRNKNILGDDFADDFENEETESTSKNKRVLIISGVIIAVIILLVILLIIAKL